MQSERIEKILDALSKYNDSTDHNHIAPRILTMQNRQGSYFRIIKHLGFPRSSKERMFRIRFLESGFEMDVAETRLNDGRMRDPYVITYSGVGCLGDTHYRKEMMKKDRKLYRVLLNRWGLMISRCYCKTDLSYRIYGAVGVRVCDRWLSFANYLHDVQLIDGFDRDKIITNEISLDKDILQPDVENKVYSKDTCLWVTQDVQLKNRKEFTRSDTIYFKVTYPDGSCEYRENVGKFATEHNLSSGTICMCLSGRRKSYKEMKFERITCDEYNLRK